MAKSKNILPGEFETPPARRPSYITLAVAGVLIFGTGWVIGRGRVQFTKHGLNYNAATAPSHNPTGDNKTLPTDLDYSSVETVYDTLRSNYDGKLDVNKLLDGMKAGLAKASGDPYTEFFNQKDAKSFDEELNGSFVGIGAELGKDDKDNLIVISPISGFPAEAAGLRPRDIIIKINGTSTAGMATDEAVTRIRGDKGTKVKLDVVRGTQALTFDITRTQITIPSVNQKILDGNIGYLQITRFADDTSKLTDQAAAKFKEAKVNGVILDLRGDPGGLLDAAVNVSSLWLDKDKTILQEKRGGVVVETFKANGGNTLKGIPTVVLVNEGSASASEITAGALKDNGVAQLVGVKSFGKGSVQELQPLSSSLLGGEKTADGVLKVTIARWFTPAGKNIDKEGITPEIEVKRSEDDFKAGRDPQQDKALEILKK